MEASLREAKELHCVPETSCADYDVAIDRSAASYLQDLAANERNSWIIRVNILGGRCEHQIVAVKSLGKWRTKLGKWSK
jgi:hypothetical protein